MTLCSNVRAEIRRLFFVRKMSVNAISRELGVHHSSVKRAVSEKYTEINVKSPKSRPSILFPESLTSSREFIEKICSEFPDISGVRLKEVLADRGISVGETTTRSALRFLRGKKKKVYGIRQAIPGVEGQVDWGEKHIKIHGTSCKIYIFTMILSYSRMLFARVCRDMCQATFMSCHSYAFKFFKGVPRKLLHDNLKTAVLERVDDFIRFTPAYVDYASHYLFEPVACHVRTPEEKGKVERQVGVIKSNFFNARWFDSLNDVNDQLGEWLEKHKARAHPDKKAETISEIWARESLQPLPKTELYPRLEISVKCGKQCYVRFQNNRYSIPPKNANGYVILRVGIQDIEIYDGSQLIALHERCYERDKVIEDREHIEKLIAKYSRSASNEHIRSFLLRVIPELDSFFSELAKLGLPMRPEVNKFDRLIARYGKQTVRKAFLECDLKGRTNADAVKLHLSESRWVEKEFKRPLPELNLPAAVKNIRTVHRDLSDYNE